MCVKFQLSVSGSSRDINDIALSAGSVVGSRYAYKRGRGTFDLDSAARSLLAR